MTPHDYDHQRMQVHFLESVLTWLVAALFLLAIFGLGSEWLIALAVMIAGVLLNLQGKHRLIAGYACPACGESPHYRSDPVCGDWQEPATPNCLHCGAPLSE